ncbi:hypothetical protein O6H91_16G058800 [Diphasiastrum complanatum]|uniref:Uncharacterized protein n=1 Tax=Diphasiastrum complanatum TaxID=34168 RepID=A0ACC2BCT3_DIPCM|nr:hypothetical protein O6H91_Y010500 [Diphasiastrum complanatum]KAJ7527512.1 hypothetical protein O6H91_16G058800 [Diphasiastrum complanatum]
MGKGKITAEFEIKVPIAKVWKAFHDPELISKAIPDQFTAVKVLEGDGFSAGSVRKLIFVAGAPHGPFLKEKIVSVDNDTHTIVTEQIEDPPLEKAKEGAQHTFKRIEAYLISYKD